MYLKEYDQSVDCFRQANEIQRHDTTFMQMGKVFTLQENYKQAGCSTPGLGVGTFHHVLSLAVRLVQLVSRLGAIAPVCPSLFAKTCNQNTN
jgi:hypothetical protein